MIKIYKGILFIIGVLWLNTACAQAPAISYSNPQPFTVGVPISQLSAQNRGGSIPPLIYSTVTTIAGNGQYGYLNGSATNAMFERPVSIAKDPSGNIYVADANANVIRKITAAGVVSTFAGSGKAGYANGQDTSASFNYPTGVAADLSGNVYVCDNQNNMIRKITPSGLVSTFAGQRNDGTGDGVGTNAAFGYPTGIAMDNSGNILVADTYNHTIRRISPSGSVTTVAGTGQRPGFANGNGTAASFNAPFNLVCDNAGNIFVADHGNNCIRKIDPSGNVTTVATGSIFRPVGIAIDQLNQLYVSADSTYSITKFDATGKQTGYSFSGNPLYKGKTNGTDTLAMYRGSMGLFYDGFTGLLVADANTDLIRTAAVVGYTVSPRLPVGLTLSANGSITGTPTQITPLTAYTVTAYNFSGSSSFILQLAVSQGTQTITFNPLPTIFYGDTDFMVNAVSTDTTVTLAYTSSNPAVATIIKNKIHIAGAGTSVITVTQPGNANYSAATPVNETLTVVPAVLTITADNKIKAAGAVNPALTYQYSGFVNGEDTLALISKPVVSTTATTSSAAGTYPITPGGGAAVNYSFSYVNGTLTVAPIPVVTASGPTTILSTDSVLLTATPSTGYTFQWALNGVSIPGATSPTYLVKASGYYSVSIAANSFTTYSTPLQVISELQLPADNFTILLTGSTCKGSNNGSINITAKQSLAYTATITGNGVNAVYPFTDSVKVQNLVPGDYSVCISVTGQIFERCFYVSVTEPKDLALYTTVNPALNTLNLQLDGADAYHITLNGEIYNTGQNQITLQLKNGVNRLVVATDKLCQGTIEKTIQVGNSITSYPNPFQNILNVNVGTQNVGKIQFNILNIQSGKVLYSKLLYNQTGVIQLDLSALTSGLYYLNVNSDNQETGFKVIKK